MRGSSTSPTACAPSQCVTAHSCCGAQCRTCRSAFTSRSSTPVSARRDGRSRSAPRVATCSSDPTTGSSYRPRHASVASSRRAVLTNRTLWRDDVSTTFHGRDIFSPVAAHLANGVDLTTVGEPIDGAALVAARISRGHRTGWRSRQLGAVHRCVRQLPPCRGAARPRGCHRPAARRRPPQPAPRRYRHRGAVVRVIRRGRGR